jgi:hypothetical protein
MMEATVLALVFIAVLGTQLSRRRGARSRYRDPDADEEAIARWTRDYAV